MTKTKISYELVAYLQAANVLCCKSACLDQIGIVDLKWRIANTYLMQILLLSCSAQVYLPKHAAPDCVTTAVRGADPGTTAGGQDLTSGGKQS